MGKTNLLAALCLPVCLMAENASDTIVRNRAVEEIVVTSTRLGLSREQISGQSLQRRNMGENLPYLLQKTPSLVVTSDDGLGIGYTYFRVRGTDQSRINMTVNGVPLNDGESQGVFWVNMTDMVASMGSVNVQRGVGTSTNGAAAFGASVNMQTEPAADDPYAELSFNGGSYGTFRESAKAGTGLMKHGFAIDARYTKVDSKGYVENGVSDLYSYYASAAWYGPRTMVKMLAFGGAERTGIAWDGIDPITWRDAPRTNNSGNYTDAAGNTVHYANHTDNYRQQHWQAHVSHLIDEHWSLNAALHCTHGNGYTEQIKNAKLVEYGLTPYVDGGGQTVKKSLLVRQKYLLNDFYGGVVAANYASNKLKATVGGAANYYDGTHYGLIINMMDENYPTALAPDHEYYRSWADKLDANAYLKAQWNIFTGFQLYGDLQYRHIDYRIHGVIDDSQLSNMDLKHTFDFFNPKAGINYRHRGHEVFGSFAMANREPVRSNYTDCGPNATPTSERLYDYEVGYRFSHRWFSVGANLYWMQYNNQLVTSGKLSDTGEALTVNVDDSYRAGAELMAGVQLGKHLRWDANLTLSRNKIRNYTDWVDDWASGAQVEVSYGTTDIAFSPSLTLGSTVSYTLGNFAAELQTNYVGKQYLDNTENEAARLDAYCVNNLRFAYTLPIQHGIKDITFSLLLNNLLNEKYVSNGWVYSYFDGSKPYTKENQVYDNENIGYFAQAQFNVHAGVAIRF